MAEDYAIETFNLAKNYRYVEAVRGLNLRVFRHRVTGFLGRNGAGKSTTIRMLLGMTRPSGGGGRLLGHRIDNPGESLQARRHVAYVGEDKELYGYMTVEQMIRFTASFYEDWLGELADALRRRYELPPERKVTELSKGMRTRLALLLALARRPELLILDEPSSGLDPVAIEELLGTLASAAGEGMTVFFSSHQISEVERIADRVCMIDYGKLAADLSLEEIRQDYRRITLGFQNAPEGRDFEINGVQHVQITGRQLVVWANGNAEGVVERARNLDAVSIDVAPVTLREVFLETVKENR